LEDLVPALDFIRDHADALVAVGEVRGCSQGGGAWELCRMCSALPAGASTAWLHEAQ
jgi:hypothetical protein